MITKKSVLLGILCYMGLVGSSWGLGNPEYVFDDFYPPNGVLKIEELDVDGRKAFQNIEIELNFATGTFILLNGQAADLTIPLDAVEEVVAEGIVLGLRACVAEENDVTCHFYITSTGSDRSVRIDGTTSAFDNLSNKYNAASITIGNQSSNSGVNMELIGDIRVEASVEFQNVSSRAQAFSQLRPRVVIVTGGSGDFTAVFENVNF